MEASFNDTLFNFRLIGLNWSVTVVFFFHSFMSHTVRTKYLKGGGALAHPVLLSWEGNFSCWTSPTEKIVRNIKLFDYFIERLIPLTQLISFPLTQYILIHSAHSTHPTQFIAIYYAHSTPLTAPHSVFYHSFRLFSSSAHLISTHSVHSHSFLSFHSFSFIPFISLIQLILFPFT